MSSTPLSFLGGVDRERGVVLDSASGIQGEAIESRVLTFPHGKGSTVGSYVLYGLVKRGHGPAAVVNERADAIVATGAILGGVPLVDAVQAALLRTGDRAIVDGDRGTVDVPTLTERPVVSAILRNRGRILIVRRSDRVGSFRGAWSGISGYLEGNEPPLERARREVREETGITRTRLAARGPLLRTRHDNDVFAIHPFLFEVPTRATRLDWENVEARWIRPSEVRDYPTVPRLPDVLAAVLPGPSHAGRGPDRPPSRAGGAGARRR